MRMMTLFGYEWKKTIAQRHLAVLLLLLLLLNTVMVYRTDYPENEYGPYVSVMLESYVADPDGFLREVREHEAYLAAVEKQQDAYDDAAREWEREHGGEPYPLAYPVPTPRFVDKEWLFDEDAIALFYSVIDCADTVAQKKEAAIERAKAFYALYAARGEADTFAARYQVALANRFIAEDRAAVTYPPIYGYGWDHYLTYGGDGVCLLLAAALLGATALLPERDGGVIAILRTSKRGRGHMMLAKGGVCLLLSVGLSLLFSGATLATFGVKYGFSGVALPLQSFFSYAVLHLRVWQAVLVRILIRALAAFSLTMLCVLLSVFLVRTPAVALCGGGVVVLSYVLSHLQLFHEHSPWHLFNLFTMLSGSAYLESWNAVSVFGLCVDYGIALPILLLFTGALLLAASVAAFSHARTRGYRHA